MRCARAAIRSAGRTAPAHDAVSDSSCDARLRVAVWLQKSRACRAHFRSPCSQCCLSGWPVSMEASAAAQGAGEYEESEHEVVPVGGSEFPPQLSSSQSFQAGEAHSPSAVLRREGSQSFRAPRSARNRRPFRVVVCKGSHEGETLIADRHSGCPSFQTARALSLWTLAKSGQQPSERESPRSFRVPSLPKPPQSARARRLSNSQFVEALVR